MRDVARVVIVASFVVIFSAAQGVQASGQQAPVPAQPTAMTNADVIRLVALKVSDATVIAVIREAKGRQFDADGTAMTVLVNNGVSPAIIDVMRQPGTSTPTLQPAATPTTKKPSAYSIDRQKLSKLYAAGKAVDAAVWASNVSARQLSELMLAFETEISIAQDMQTKTFAEMEFVSTYGLAKLQFELGLLERNNKKKNYGLDSLKKASDTLEAANKNYLVEIVR